MNKNKELDLWERLTSFQNLLQAYRLAAKGRRGRVSVADFERNLEINLFEIQKELIEGRYEFGKYTSFHIHDPKTRLISAAPFRDRVIHHALCNIIEPIFEKKFIFDTYANRREKGTHKALDRCTHFLRRFRYLLPMDIVQFFPSIDHGILMKYLSEVILDQRVNKLCQQIISSGKGILNNEYDMVFFSGDDLLSVFRPRGLPIGNLTSQFLANVYLNPLDHYIKRELKVPGYVRYVDDMLIFSNTKQELNEWKDSIVAYLSILRLTIHDNSTQCRPTRTGIPFLGFQVFPDHRRLKHRKAIQAGRRLKTMAANYRKGLIDLKTVNHRIQSWVAHAVHGDTWGLRKDILSQLHFY